MVSEQPEIVWLLVLGNILIDDYVPDLAAAVEQDSWHLDLAVELLHGY